MNRLSLLTRLRSSLLPLPAIAGLLAVALSVLTSTIDRRFAAGRALFPGGAASARSLLSSIASASLTLTAVVFSITMLVLQLTSAQYSPRVLRRFLGDRVSQAALAVFTSTFTFSLAALRGVQPNAVPATSVAIAFVLALLTIGVFVIYVNHIAQEIRVSSIISAISREARRALEDTNSGGDEEVPQWPHQGSGATVVAAPRDGVVVGVNVPGMVAAAQRAGAAVELVPLIGDWVVEGAPLLRVSGPAPEDESGFTDQVTLGDERDMRQDRAYGIRQLVDIADRALSPGANDPTTAVQAIQAVHSLLARLATQPTPSGIACDGDAEPRFRQRERPFADVLDLCVDEVLLYGQRSLQVTAALEHMLDDLLRVAGDERGERVAARLADVRRVRQRLLSGEASFAARGTPAPPDGDQGPSSP